VVLLPLDVLKIKMQTNPDAVRGRGFFRLITDEGVASLYRGWGWTMARNAPGSFAVRLCLRLNLVNGTSLISRIAIRRVRGGQGVPLPSVRLLHSHLGTK
jgi:hypothetical protein